MSTADFESARRGSIPRRGALINLNLMSSECAGFARDPAKVEDQVRFLARAFGKGEVEGGRGNVMLIIVPLSTLRAAAEDAERGADELLERAASSILCGTLYASSVAIRQRPAILRSLCVGSWHYSPEAASESLRFPRRTNVHSKSQRFINLNKWTSLSGGGSYLFGSGCHGKIFGRNVVGQPDMVFGNEELEAVCMHSRRINGQHDRLPVAHCNLNHRLDVR